MVRFATSMTQLRHTYTPYRKAETNIEGWY